jgi:predicted HicB family RNase H-like nuclease
MNTKKTVTAKKSRTNTPRERGAYKSYSMRILKRDLDRLQKKARREKISFNTWMVSALLEKLAPAPKPEEIELVEVVEVPSGDSVQA